MILILTMPQFGESITQAKIVQWLKKEGDSVKEAEPLVEMETEKSVFAYESPFQGKLVKILAPAGENDIPVGAEIAQFDVSDEDGKKYLSLGVGKETTKESTVLPKVQTIPLAPIRARIADNMILSKQKIPHAGCSLDVDFGTAEKWRVSQAKPPSYLSIAVMAVLKTLKNYPSLNSSLKEAEGKRWIEQYHDVHLGIAVATPQGLMVPVIHNAQAKTFSEIREEIERLVAGGRSGALKVDDLTGATFTVNNTGAIGATRSVQIIPYPQAAILATNRIVRKPWGVGEKIEIRPIMSLDIAFDHRIIDGDEAGRFLTELKKNLESGSFF